MLDSEVCQPTFRTKHYIAPLTAPCSEASLRLHHYNLVITTKDRAYTTQFSKYISPWQNMLTQHQHYTAGWFPQCSLLFLSHMLWLRSTRNVWTALAYMLRNLMDILWTTLSSYVRSCLHFKQTALRPPELFQLKSTEHRAKAHCKELMHPAWGMKRANQ